jgi:hypothetical protein
MDGGDLRDTTLPTDEHTSGWEMVRLGIAVPRSYFCICCLAFHGAGMTRNGFSYCLDCWGRRQRGELCAHESNLQDLRRPKAV